jgi:predicted lipoprotein with Yx(FWY)xxD motif
VETVIRSLGPPRVLIRRRMPLAVVAVAAAAVVAAACGSYPGGRVGSYGLAPSSAPAGGARAVGSKALTLRHTALGTILTTGKGFTVYAFEADKGTMSACTGACAAVWPPVTASGNRITVAGGATMSLVAETTRSGGVHQLTYAGHPLYTFTGDTSPGTTNGQGSEAFGARWDVLTAAGQEVTDG